MIKFPPLSSLSSVVLFGSALLAFQSAAFAGHELVARDSGKQSVQPEAEAPYEAGRGLVTLEGPSGMFINPTSATLPKGAYTAQYCTLFLNSDDEVMGHGWLASYGFTDWLEVGTIGTVLEVPGDREFVVAGPFVRVRLTKDQGWIPQISVGAYGKYGTNVLAQSTGFVAAYKRFPISETGFLRSVGVHAGARFSWFHADALETDSLDGYGGIELQLPARLYLVGEVGTRGENQGGGLKRIPYAYGLQWRMRAVNISAALMQRGTDAEVSLFLGVGLALKL
jgi:hypothetical protein